MIADGKSKQAQRAAAKLMACLTFDACSSNARSRHIPCFESGRPTIKAMQQATRRRNLTVLHCGPRGPFALKKLCRAMSTATGAELIASRARQVSLRAAPCLHAPEACVQLMGRLASLRPHAQILLSGRRMSRCVGTAVQCELAASFPRVGAARLCICRLPCPDGSSTEIITLGWRPRGRYK